MTFQAAPNGVKVALVQNQNGVPVVNTFHVKTAGTVTDTDLISIGNIFLDWWRDDIRPYCVPSLSLDQIVVTDISIANGHQVQLNVVTDNTGTLSSAALGGNSAMVISWRTPNTGRSFRGRSYIGGLGTIELVDAQHFQATTIAGMAGSAVNLIDVLETAGYILCVISRVSAGVARVSALLTQITGVIVDTVVDTMRRRTAN